MSKRNRRKWVGVGAAACAACCAPPVLALLAATGIASVVGFVLFGAVALVVGAAAITLVLRSRGRSRPDGHTTPVEITDRPPR